MYLYGGNVGGLCIKVSTSFFFYDLSLSENFSTLSL